MSSQPSTSKAQRERAKWDAWRKDQYGYVGTKVDPARNFQVPDPNSRRSRKKRARAAATLAYLERRRLKRKAREAIKKRDKKEREKINQDQRNSVPGHASLAFTTIASFRPRSKDCEPDPAESRMELHADNGNFIARLTWRVLGGDKTGAWRVVKADKVIDWMIGFGMAKVGIAMEEYRYSYRFPQGEIRLPLQGHDVDTLSSNSFSAPAGSLKTA